MGKQTNCAHRTKITETATIDKSGFQTTDLDEKCTIVLVFVWRSEYQKKICGLNVEKRHKRQRRQDKIEEQEETLMEWFP